MILAIQKNFHASRARKAIREGFVFSGSRNRLIGRVQIALFFSGFLLFSSSVSANERELSQQLCQKSEIFFQMGKDLVKRNQNLLATQFLSQYSIIGCLDESRRTAKILWAQALYNLGENEEALEVLKSVSGAELEKKSEVIKGWYQPEIRHLLSSETQSRFEKWDRWTREIPPRKKPWVAGSLSAVVPGMGQVYNGNYQSAAFSFVLNALFLSAAIETQQKGLYATSLASATIFSVVYVGNILGSVQAAQAINNRESAEVIENEKARVFPELFSF